MTEFSDSSSHPQKMSHSVPCELCDAFSTEAEKAKAAGEADRAQLILFILREHKKACH
jgi:hypothetical protein